MKWQRKNLRNRLVFAVRNPGYAVRALLQELASSDERFLARVTAVSAKQIRSYLDEPIATPEFAQRMHEAESEFRKLRITSADLYAKKALLQYAAVRALRPDTIVETGIANGVSSAYFLLALEKNGKGQLHSIGLPDPAFLPRGKKPGWLVPDWLRQRWETYLGDVRDILPNVLLKVEPLDLFVHDSLHTYEHMSWEFEAAYPHIRKSGLLLADDALWNEAFMDFSLSVGALDARILRGVGVMRKN